MKKTWGIINELTSRKQSNSHVKEIKLTPGLSEAFNTHFASIGPKLTEKIPCDENNCSYFLSMRMEQSDWLIRLSQRAVFLHPARCEMQPARCEMQPAR